MYSKLQDGSFMICGYVPRDAEFRHVGEKNSSLCKWSVKVGEKLNGNKKEAVWTSCQAWHDAARAAANIRKGDTVLCIGRLETNEYEGRTYKNLVCEYINIMGKAAAGVPASAASDKAPVVDPGDIDLNEFEVLISDPEMPF